MISGGDPLKHADVYELIEHAVSKNLETGITPSPTPLVTTAAIQRLKRAGIARMAVSIDGADAATHDRMRGVFPWNNVVDVYQNSPIFRRLRDAESFEGKCGVCEYRRLCGGSRARACAVNGDPYASEPDCIDVPPRWEHFVDGSPSPVRFDVVPTIYSSYTSS